MSESEQPKDPNNPYNARNHEAEVSMDREDVLAVAGLLGSVSRNLSDIDSKNVGGSNPFTQAKKMDPKAVLKDMTQGHSVQSPPPPVPVQQVPVPTAQPIPVPTTQPGEIVYSPGMEELIKRIDALESALEKTNRALKFKRGISYDINTASIKGNFKSPSDIIDIVLAELAKNTKTITLKLNDTSKNRK